MPLAVQRWDPYTILKIDQAQTLCYGWSHSKGRHCGILVAAANRHEAHRLLARLARYDPSSDDVLSKLDQIAHLLLCRGAQKRHQAQAATVVETWEGNIADLVESTTDSDNEEEEVESSTDGPEGLGDLRVEMAEAQRILTRVATALSTREDRLLRLETSSVTADDDNEPNQNISDDDLETLDSQTVEGDHDDHAQSQSSQLSLDHVQSLVRQLTLEHEEGRRRGIRSGGIHNASEAPVSVATDSPRTVVTASPELQIDTPQDAVTRSEEPSVIPQSSSSPTEVFGPSNTADDAESSISASMPPQTLESAADGDTPRYITPYFSQSLVRAGSSIWDVNSGARRSLFSGLKQIKQYIMPFWQAILFFYLGLLFATYFLQPSQQSGVRTIGPGWGGSDQAGGRLERPMLDAPVIKSVVRMEL